YRDRWCRITTLHDQAMFLRESCALLALLSHLGLLGCLSHGAPTFLQVYPVKQEPMHPTIYHR
ncbi:MAG: hypothetical protein RLZZ478_997, partial [Actinomycetota bacterium]